jgi:uncharacterized protein YbjT (DUF2867 family)
VKVTQAEQVDAIGAAIGAPVRFEELDPAAARKQWLDDGFDEETADWVIELLADSVEGATGLVGRHVVAELVGRGQRVRALTRRQSAAGLPDGVEVVGGDLTDPSSLQPALIGVEKMYLFPVGRTAREVVAAAKLAGVRRVVVLSGALADTDDSDDGTWRSSGPSRNPAWSGRMCGPASSPRTGSTGHRP